MIRILSFIIFITVYNTVQSQTRDNVWFDGNIVLMNNEELSGKVNYNIRDQLIQIKNDTVIQAFSEGKIRSMLLTYGSFKHEFILVAVKDENNRVRTLLAELIYQSTNNYSYFKRHQADTEVIVYYGGPVAPVANILSVGLVIPVKQKLESNTNKDSFTSYENDLSRRNFIKLLIDYRGNKVILKRKSLLETLSDKKKELRKLIKEKKLHFYNDDDIISMLKFYDEIKN